MLIGGLARAGKSYAAQVLKELLHSMGQSAHVVCLDGWLKPKDARAEGEGVCERFDLAAASRAIRTVLDSSTRAVLCEPLYDRSARRAGRQFIEHSIGPGDLLIVEGVPALLMDGLVTLPRTLTVYVEVDRVKRNQRLHMDYAWREGPQGNPSAMLASREHDETPIVEQSRKLANFVVKQQVEENE
jgi:pantothenate kinase